MKILLIHMTETLNIQRKKGTNKFSWKSQVKGISNILYHV